MSYTKVIESIPGWRSLPLSEILAKAKEPSQDYISNEWYSLLGVAGIIGHQNVKPLMEFLTSLGYSWIEIQAGGKGLPLGDAVFHAVLKSIPHPHCQLLAETGRRKVSFCELCGVPQDDAKLELAWRNCKLRADRADLLREGSLVWNAFSDAVGEWDGDPATKPRIQ